MYELGGFSRLVQEKEETLSILALRRHRRNDERNGRDDGERIRRIPNPRPQRPRA